MSERDDKITEVLRVIAGIHHETSYISLGGKHLCIECIKPYPCPTIVAISPMLAEEDNDSEEFSNEVKYIAMGEMITPDEDPLAHLGEQANCPWCGLITGDLEGHHRYWHGPPRTGRWNH